MFAFTSDQLSRLHAKTILATERCLREIGEYAVTHPNWQATSLYETPFYFEYDRLREIEYIISRQQILTSYPEWRIGYRNQ